MVTPVQYFEPTEDHDGTVPLLQYLGDSTLTAREHIADSYEAEHGEDKQDRTEAVKWLEEYLAMEGPSVRSSEAKRAAKAAGIAERTLQRARKQLNVVIGYVGNPPVSTWTLPQEKGHQSSSGTTAEPGITTAHNAVPRSANGHNVTQGNDQQICHEQAVVPHTDLKAARQPVIAAKLADIGGGLEVRP
jgi:hypothetical protein